MKKYVNDMTTDEMKNLIECDNALHDELFDYAWENAGDYLYDYLRNCPADYSIGLDQDDHFKIYDEKRSAFDIDEFEEWFTNIQQTYCFLSSDEEKTINEFIRYEHIAYKLTYDVTANPKDDEYVLEHVTDLKEQSEEIILNRCQAEYNACYDSYVLVDWMICTGEYMDKFIIDDDYSHLYKHINGHYEKAQDVLIA